MNKKSMGQFIAALRKANGMTQQEVADRLNVSNKAISRWERDECAPDITLIPALAEMFGVTCDELLKGERIHENTTAEKSEPKIDKQIKALINRSVSSFKTTILISVALAIVGFICMLGISYGFYRPIIGFAVLMLFETAAFIVALIATNKLRDVKTDNELFENADSILTDRFNQSLASLSFTAFFTIITGIALSAPLTINKTNYIGAVVSSGYYFTVFVPVIILVLALLFFMTKEPYYAWINGIPYISVQKTKNPAIYRMNLFQFGSIVLGGLLFIIAPYFDTPSYGEAPVLYIISNILAFILLCFGIIIFLIFVTKFTEDRKELAFVGLRNLLLIPCIMLCASAHNISYVCYDIYADKPHYKKLDSWDYSTFLVGVVLFVLVILVFKVIEIIKSKKTNNYN